MAQRRRGNRRIGIRRDNFVKLSLSDDEHALISRAARAQGATLSGFAAHAALGVARHTLDTAPGARESLIALNDGVTALTGLSERIDDLLAAGADPAGVGALMDRLTAAVETLEEAGDTVLGHSQT